MFILIVKLSLGAKEIKRTRISQAHSRKGSKALEELEVAAHDAQGLC